MRAVIVEITRAPHEPLDPHRRPAIALPSPECASLASVLASVGDKWTILVLGALANGPVRYNALMRRLDISQRMLTLTLKRLEATGLVTRTLFASVPPRVDYDLTDLGHTLRAALVPLSLWAATHHATLAAHRAATPFAHAGRA